MKRLLAAASLAGLVSLSALGQPAPVKPEPKREPPAPAAGQPAGPKPTAKTADKGADKTAEEDAWKRAAEVGPNHKFLESFEGEWQAEVKETTPAGDSVSKGTLKSGMAFGGRFLAMDYDGRMHGKFFKGGGYLGYSNTDKRFEMMWADSMATAMSVMTGSLDSTGKVLSLAGDYTDPVTNKKARQRCVFTVTGKDSYREEVYMDQGGKEARVMDITYTRSKGDQKDGKADKPQHKDEVKKDDKKPEPAKPK